MATTSPLDGPQGAEREVRFWPMRDLAGLDFDPLLAELLANDPVTRIRLPQGEGDAWLVTRYRDVQFVSNDPRFSRKAVRGRSVTRVAPHFIPLDQAVNFFDPPEHTRVRRTVAKAFAARRMRALQPRVQQLADELLDAVERHGPPADLVAMLHAPFPLAALSTLMGVPPEDWPRIDDWTERVLSAARGRQDSDRAKAEMGAYYADLLRHRLAEPREDLVSTLARAVREEQATEEEMAATAVLIHSSGIHAVRNNSANMVYALLTHPRQLDRLRADRSLLPQAVEELLRFIPHRNGVGLSRIAVADVEVGGVLIREGDAVYVSYLSANRDPAVFADPDALDFDRQHNPHLAFGHGPHHCLGASLARMESQMMLAGLLDRFPELRLAVPVEQVRWRASALIRGPVALPVTW
ncbi:cytochrome [Wenjunlia vitaminophila]|uniref:Cytochrome n=1 Tax=Wenjunlia vitaminophila TaxID=76728 RepID=A0A0T6LWZ6_WENVI|nr:cytochrome P450 [Wenjunlia vitaminophila]KRV50529.1 cytochrome [Wenjunlia vitaminophila]